eukprot:TRINITY_DN5934_c0_g1_i1.p1 TRINITY_DN5934_c0_g1~~TRINITY_DN5934_c0_g1_i1.p1  ORF type:complete len:1132 (+),score=388.77 TRINITY_DN5934_c0_g1_i1:85-3480(+)
MDEDTAATLIQAAWRGFQMRSWLEVWAPVEMRRRAAHGPPQPPPPPHPPTATQSASGRYDWSSDPSPHLHRFWPFRERVPETLTIQAILPGVKAIAECDVSASSDSLRVWRLTGGQDDPSNLLCNVVWQWPVHPDSAVAKYSKKMGRLTVSCRVTLEPAEVGQKYGPEWMQLSGTTRGLDGAYFKEAESVYARDDGATLYQMDGRWAVTDDTRADVLLVEVGSGGSSAPTDVRSWAEKRKGQYVKAPRVKVQAHLPPEPQQDDYSDDYDDAAGGVADSDGGYSDDYEDDFGVEEQRKETGKERAEGKQRKETGKERAEGKQKKRDKEKEGKEKEAQKKQKKQKERKAAKEREEAKKQEEAKEQEEARSKQRPDSAARRSAAEPEEAGSGSPARKQSKEGDARKKGKKKKAEEPAEGRPPERQRGRDSPRRRGTGGADLSPRKEEPQPAKPRTEEQAAKAATEEEDADRGGAERAEGKPKKRKDGSQKKGKKKGRSSASSTPAPTPRIDANGADAAVCTLAATAACAAVPEPPTALASACLAAAAMAVVSAQSSGRRQCAAAEEDSRTSLAARAADDCDVLHVAEAESRRRIVLCEELLSFHCGVATGMRRSLADATASAAARDAVETKRRCETVQRVGRGLTGRVHVGRKLAHRGRVRATETSEITARERRGREECTALRGHAAWLLWSHATTDAEDAAARLRARIAAEEAGDRGAAEVTELASREAARKREAERKVRENAARQEAHLAEAAAREDIEDDAGMSWDDLLSESHDSWICVRRAWQRQADKRHGEERAHAAAEETASRREVLVAEGVHRTKCAAAEHRDRAVALALRRARQQRQGLAALEDKERRAVGDECQSAASELRSAEHKQRSAVVAELVIRAQRRLVAAEGAARKRILADQSRQRALLEESREDGTSAIFEEKWRRTRRGEARRIGAAPRVRPSSAPAGGRAAARRQQELPLGDSLDWGVAAPIRSRGWEPIPAAGTAPPPHPADISARGRMRRKLELIRRRRPGGLVCGVGGEPLAVGDPHSVWYLAKISRDRERAARPERRRLRRSSDVVVAAAAKAPVTSRRPIAVNSLFGESAYSTPRLTEQKEVEYLTDLAVRCGLAAPVSRGGSVGTVPFSP